MNTCKGFRLYVNLGASQTRRRLKGFGHGVRRVEVSGKGQSVVIHTATGGHLRELERKLGDVLRRDSQTEAAPHVPKEYRFAPAITVEQRVDHGPSE